MRGRAANTPRRGEAVRKLVREEGIGKPILITKVRDRNQENGRIASFFFSIFPGTFNEEHLRNISQKYNTVWGVYIANRRGKWDNQFGFVRFIGVQNAKSLERQLHQIRIGNTKMNRTDPNCETKHDFNHLEIFG